MLRNRLPLPQILLMRLTALHLILNVSPHDYTRLRKGEGVVIRYACLSVHVHSSKYISDLDQIFTQGAV